MTDRVLMIRPSFFGFDEETAASNVFQERDLSVGAAGVAGLAREEFDALVAALRGAGVSVVVAGDAAGQRTPDSVFPNNWISFHGSGQVVLYPMCAVSRRAEVRPELIGLVEEAVGVRWPRRVDLTGLVGSGAFVEGTGSLIFDEVGGVVFACRSARTTDAGLDAVEGALGVETVRFDACDEDGVAYYHTNVMLSVGRGLVVVCEESIAEVDRGRVMDRLRGADREVVLISRKQVRRFAGNVLELRSAGGEALVVMSESARGCLDGSQLATVERAGRIISVPLPTIERVGGGSARCMIAEIELPI